MAMIPIPGVGTEPASHRLRELRVELLRGCPLRCQHCSAHAAPMHPLQLAPERVLTVLDEFADLGGQRVTFTGGEPLDYDGIVPLLEHCRRHQLTTRLFSSGITLSGSTRAMNAEMLEHVAPLTNTIIFSLYGALERTHDAVTLFKGSFALTRAAITRARTLGISVGIHFVPTQANYRELPMLAELAISLGVDQISLLRFVPHGRGRMNQQRLALDASAHRWLRQVVFELRERYPKLMLKLGSAYNLLGAGEPVPCTAAIDQLVIEADGAVTPCSAFAGYRIPDPFGNIHQHSLQAVWKHSIYLEHVRAAVLGTNACAGCLAQKVLASGRIDAAETDPLMTEYFTLHTVGFAPQEASA